MIPSNGITLHLNGLSYSNDYVMRLWIAIAAKSNRAAHTYRAQWDAKGATKITTSLN